MTMETALRDCPPGTLIDARNMAHKAVQPVTRAARVNIPAEPDESHTNLAWDSARAAFLSNPIATGDGPIAVGLALSNLSLLVVRGDQTVAERPLSGISVGDAGDWLDSQLVGLGLGKASPVSHPYDLPPGAAEIATYATDGIEEELASLTSWFALSDSVLRDFASDNADIRPGPSPIRCWAHHFDIATYVSLEAGDFESARAIGVGLSPGDESYAEPYFYVNPWPRLDPRDLPVLSGLGHWHTEGFVGAILTGSELLATADAKRGAAQFIADAFALGRGRLGL
ncbi:MAG: hypothetical protein GY798_26020 [Hyphomicrobiales bacterium]|nr:hypothetical protein [Hyphomicrobiales bacterium]